MKSNFPRFLGSLTLLILLPACGVLNGFFSARTTAACNVSQRLPDHPVAEQMVAPVGEYPIWFVTVDSVAMSELGKSLLPYDGGTVRKGFVVVSTDFEGEAVITGRQIDGDAVMLFPLKIDEDFENEAGENIIIYSEDDITDRKVIPDAQDSTFGTNAPGYAHHPIGLYFPTPGCYELSGTFGGYTTHVIIELRDE